jgi:hypothetical protein
LHFYGVLVAVEVQRLQGLHMAAVGEHLHVALLM